MCFYELWCDTNPHMREVTVLHTLLHIMFLMLTRVLRILLCNHFAIFIHANNAMLLTLICMEYYCMKWVPGDPQKKMLN